MTHDLSRLKLKINAIKVLLFFRYIQTPNNCLTMATIVRQSLLRVSGIQGARKFTTNSWNKSKCIPITSNQDKAKYNYLWANEIHLLNTLINAILGAEAALGMNFEINNDQKEVLYQFSFIDELLNICNIAFPMR